MVGIRFEFLETTETAHGSHVAWELLEMLV
jgi:hypothetical protein